MAQLVVRNIEEDVRDRLREMAEAHGQSMEEKVHDILRAAAFKEPAPQHGPVPQKAPKSELAPKSQQGPESSKGIGTQIVECFAGIRGLAEKERIHIEELHWGKMEVPDFARKDDPRP